MFTKICSLRLQMHLELAGQGYRRIGLSNKHTDEATYPHLSNGPVTVTRSAELTDVGILEYIGVP